MPLVNLSPAKWSLVSFHLSRDLISRGDVNIKGIRVGFGQEENAAPVLDSSAPFDMEELTSMMDEVMTIN